MLDSFVEPDERAARSDAADDGIRCPSWETDDNFSRRAEAVRSGVVRILELSRKERTGLVGKSGGGLERADDARVEATTEGECA